MIPISAARALIESALVRDGYSYTYEDVVKAVDEDRMQYWAGPNSVIVTEIVEYPQRKSIHFFLAAGNLGELEPMVPIIESWGKSKGCTAATMTGRKGWERVTFLKRGGWKSQMVVMQKELK